MGKLYDHWNQRTTNRTVEPWSEACGLCGLVIDQSSAQMHFANAHGIMACGGSGIWSRETAREMVRFVRKNPAAPNPEGGTQ